MRKELVKEKQVEDTRRDALAIEAPGAPGGAGGASKAAGR